MNGSDLNIIIGKSTNVCCTYIFYVSYSKLIIKYKIIIKFVFCSIYGAINIILFLNNKRKMENSLNFLFKVLIKQKYTDIKLS